MKPSYQKQHPNTAKRRRPGAAGLFEFGIRFILFRGWLDHFTNLQFKNKNLWTVAVGLMYLDETQFTRFAVGSIFIAVPIIILYFALSGFLMSGVTAGAAKE